jgi:hypothetical protein
VTALPDVLIATHDQAVRSARPSASSRPRSRPQKRKTTMPDQLTPADHARMRAEAAARPGYAIYPPHTRTHAAPALDRTAALPPAPWPQLDPTPRRTGAAPRLDPDRYADLAGRVRERLDQVANDVAAVRAAPVRPARKRRWWWPW